MTELLFATLRCGLVLGQFPPSGAGGGGVTVSRSWTMEILLSVVFVGLTLFAVCRRSNRT